jgi:hypothetical protein
MSQGNIESNNASYATIPITQKIQHEMRRHSNYHEYPLNVLSPLEYCLIFNIKKKLTLNHRSLEKKSITIPCSEGMYALKYF